MLHGGQLTDPQALRQRAKTIIGGNRYMTLATSDKRGPWAAPVAYVTDEYGDFYWASRHDARHSRSIELQGLAAIAVFNSTAHHENVDGIQAEGHAAEVAATDLNHVFGLYVARYAMYAALPREQLTGAGRFRLYRFSPQEMYLLDPDSSEGDQRVPVDLPL